MNTSYTLHTDQFGTISVDHVQSEPPDVNERTLGDTISITVSVSESEISDLLNYDEHAGKITISSALDNTRYYREFLPSSTQIGTLLIGVEPNSELQSNGINGFWGLVGNIEDNRPKPFTNPSLTLEVQTLAYYSDYADIASVESALKV